jgi:triphosphoribosyl-dephospho-CoA synthase
VSAPHGRRCTPRQLAAAAVRALVEEALLTPKPALVDQRGNGAHRDMDLASLLRSAEALRASFQLMAVQAAVSAAGVPLRERLGALGREAEVHMLAASGGCNTHRGAIFALGLLLAAHVLNGAQRGRGALGATAAALARLPDRHGDSAGSHGSRVRQRFHVGGARAEARAGFPHVLRLGLPALERGRSAGASESCARLDALMAIMTSLPDTCLLHRGGWPALRAAQRGARRVLARGGAASAAGRRALLALDGELTARGASPGGCADLLAATLFVDHIVRA